jgi:hypothetical protein
MPVQNCPSCGVLWLVHARLPGAEARCPQCWAAGRRRTGLWALAAVLAALVTAAALWRHLP